MLKNSLALPQLDERAATERVIELMAIPGKSCEEWQVVQHLIRELKQAGVPASAIHVDQVFQKSPAKGTVGNLIVTLPGTMRGPRRLLMAHLDTVPLAVGSEPFRRFREIRSANPQTALGGDNRSGVAVVLTAIIEILKQKLPYPPLTLFFPVQEEIGLNGARYVNLSKLGNPKLCFNWDGGAADSVCIGATGAFDLEIEIEGIASHAGVHPEDGVSAIVIAGMAIADLQKNGYHGLIVKGKSRGTSNIGVISGGDATNVVTSLVKLRGEVRSHDRNFRKRLVAEFEMAFLRAVRAVKNKAGRQGKLHFKSTLKYEPFCLRENEPCVQAAIEAIRLVGLDPTTKISNGGLDANWLSERGLPTVTLGAGQKNVHTTEESLDLDAFMTGCQVGLLLASAWQPPATSR
ncbi:MAG: M20/M25/M40 family metallo-hydrolase [Planctomycetes bacterium]|nr:M20/M25/M40 family metallo-hydrolase [Planctomycetota bacterium]